MAVFVDLDAVWSNRRLPFRLRRAEVKRLRIVVDPEGRVTVTAPLHATDKDVIARVSRRGDWIRRQQQQFKRWMPRMSTRQYVSGETHLFLGDQLRLLIVTRPEPSVERVGNRLVVGLQNRNDRALARELVRRWFSAQARTVLRERWHAQRATWARHGAQATRVLVRPLRSRWGSMTTAGCLVLNADLVRASPRLIDYVIAHELAHAKFPDHGKRWQDLMHSVMPDWPLRKSQLELQLL